MDRSMICAGTKENVVVALIKVDSEEQYQLFSQHFELLIDTTPYSYVPQIGWTIQQDGSLGPVSWKISKLSMQQRFTLAEQMAFQTALNAQNVLVQVLNKQMSLATYVDLHRTDVQQSLGALVQGGLLTSQRMTEILTTPPTISETYKGQE